MIYLILLFYAQFFVLFSKPFVKEHAITSLYALKPSLAVVHSHEQANIEKKLKENYDQFFGLLTIVARNFGGNFVKDTEKLEIDLNGANSLLLKVHEIANIVLQKDKKEKIANFKMAIQKLADKKSEEKLEEFLNVFEVPNGIMRSFIEAQLFNLLFSFAVRLEVLIHGKEIDDTTEEENEEGPGAGKIQTFLSFLNSYEVPEWANKFGIFDFWMEIEYLKATENNNKKLPPKGVIIYRKLNFGNDNALHVSRDTFKMLKLLNEQKFSIYETTKLLKRIYDGIEINCASSYLQIAEIVEILHDQMKKESVIKDKIKGWLTNPCDFVMLFQNVSKKFMKMMDEQGIDQQKHLDWLDNQLQKTVNEEYFPKYCERNVKNNWKEIWIFNNVRYDLVIHFEHNVQKDIYERTEDFLLEWNNQFNRGISDTNCDERNSEEHLKNIGYLTSNKYRGKLEEIKTINESEKMQKENEQMVKKNVDELLKEILVQFDNVSIKAKEIKKKRIIGPIKEQGIKKGKASKMGGEGGVEKDKRLLEQAKEDDDSLGKKEQKIAKFCKSREENRQKIAEIDSLEQTVEEKMKETIEMAKEFVKMLQNLCIVSKKNYEKDIKKG